MIVRITRAKVGHCQTPIYDTRLMAGVMLYGKQRKENTMERKSSENKSENKMETNRDRNKGIGISRGEYLLVKRLPLRGCLKLLGSLSPALETSWVEPDRSE